jgi:hypothetical protein
MQQNLYILTFWPVPKQGDHQFLSTPADIDRRVETMTKRLNTLERSSPLMLLLLHGGAGVQVGKDQQ